MPLLLLHFLVIHVGDNFARNGVCLSLSLSPLLSPPSGILKNSRKLVDNGSRRRIYEETWNYSRLVFHLTKSNLLESKKKESKSVSFRSKTSYYHPSNTSFRIDPISIWYPLFSKQRRGEILQRGLGGGRYSVRGNTCHRETGETRGTPSCSPFDRNKHRGRTETCPYSRSFERKGFLPLLLILFE